MLDSLAKTNPVTVTTRDFWRVTGKRGSACADFSQAA
jgi:hypothetical protein